MGNGENYESISLVLSAIIAHKGLNIREGHYIAYVNVDGSWFQCNDSDVQEISWETVRREKVYLIFYLRL